MEHESAHDPHPHWLPCGCNCRALVDEGMRLASEGRKGGLQAVPCKVGHSSRAHSLPKTDLPRFLHGIRPCGVCTHSDIHTPKRASLKLGVIEDFKNAPCAITFMFAFADSPLSSRRQVQLIYTAEPPRLQATAACYSSVHSCKTHASYR
jgi:hypothetical protein